MTIDTINKRIENAQKKLDKLNKKMARIEKAAKSNYEQDNPYYYSEYDMKSCKKDIAETEESLKKYQDMLSEETDKAASRNVSVLVEFLNMWRDNARNWYNDRRNSNERKEMKKAIDHANKIYRRFEDTRWSKLSSMDKKLAEELGANSEHAEVVWNDPRAIKFRTEQDKKSNQLKAKYMKAYDAYKDAFGEIDDMEYEAYYVVQKTELDKLEAEYKANRQKWVPWDHHIELTTAQKNKAWSNYIEKLLQKEWDRKYDKLLNDVIRITGTIDDASNLRVNEKGDLDGYVIGKKGKAKINTFGAGGYNIQCFHYRTKVTRVK